MPSSISPQNPVARKKTSVDPDFETAEAEVADGKFLRTKLLVSVKNPLEAELALRLGVDWIDVKDPSAGSLGSPTSQVVESVARVLESSAPDEINRSILPPSCSVALGELTTLDFSHACQCARLYPICKVGLARTRGSDQKLAPHWAIQLTQLHQNTVKGQQLVLAAYADEIQAQSPSVDSVISLSKEFGLRYVLIDTFLKDGRGILDWIEPAELQEYQKRVQDFGADLVIAGSLTLSGLEQLTTIKPRIVAVRGAVCSGNRRGELSAERVVEWQNELKKFSNYDSTSQSP